MNEPPLPKVDSNNEDGTDNTNENSTVFGLPKRAFILGILGPVFMAISVFLVWFIGINVAMYIASIFIYQALMLLLVEIQAIRDSLE